MRQIVWLASYPKSGNTWLRLLLANLMSDGDEPVDINELGLGQVASSRRIFDAVAGIEAGELTHGEVDRIRPDVYRTMAERAHDTIFVKVHDAYQRLDDGGLLFPDEVTRGAVYLVRNPLDVCVSLAYHMGGREFACVARSLADPDMAFSAGTGQQHHQLRQRLSSWSGHVESWTRAGVPVHVVRYEDLTCRPVEVFADAAAFLGMPHDRPALERAVAWSSFERIQAQERTRGFRERPSVAASFFRKGEVGSWREVLSLDLAERIVRAHGEVMRRLGYLSPEGEIVY